MGDKDFTVKFGGFNEGNSPLAHLDDKTFIGNMGQASDMKADILTKPGFLTQSPSLTNLTNGSSATGVVEELIRFILDKPVGNITFGVGTAKLFKISTSSVINDATWPQAVTNMTEGESVIRLKTNVYAFFNKATGGEILRMPIATEVIDQTWGSVADQALEKAPHPSAVKEDILAFGNGQYLGVYIEGLGILDTHKLDFGEGTEVVDVVFHANMWWIAVNSGEGKRSQVYMYDGSAISNVLSDETGIGDQKIGFLYVKNGLIFIAYEDLSSDTFVIGYLVGREIKPLRYFKGTLPDHRQKALYKNTIMFVSDGELWTFGSSVEQLPLQISKIADGGLDDVGGIASPFGNPMVPSMSGINARLAQLDGISKDSIWKSTFNDVTSGRNLGKIHTVIVTSKPLVGDAKCDIKLEGNQGSADTGMTSNTLEYSGVGTTRKVFRTIVMKSVEDLRAIVDFSDSDTTNDCPIKSIECLGVYTER